MTQYTYIDGIEQDIGGGGERVATVSLETGHEVYIAYGQIGVYAPGDLERMNAGESITPLALWDYVSAPVDGSHIADSFTSNTGGGTMVDTIILAGEQELGVRPAIHLNDECVVYAPYDTLNADCPVCGEWHTDPETIAQCFTGWGDRSVWLY